MFENKKILVLGLAKSGYEVCKVLSKLDNDITLTDLNTSTSENIINDLKNMGVKLVLGKHPDDLLDSCFDYLIKNPGIAIDHKCVLDANKLGIPVINEVEVAYHLIPKDKNIKIIGITGSNGKTTTTTLIYNFLKEAKRRVHLAGNIGYPLCSFLDKLNDNDIIVTEISCQQLENTNLFNPDVAVMTNISEAHLEFMKTFEHYKYVKSKIFKNQTSNDVLIINNNDSILQEMVKTAKSNIKYFSKDCYIENNAIYYYNEKVIDLSLIKLRGEHNYENIMAAIIAVKEFGVDNDSIVKVLKEFNGVEHRLEYVKEVNKRIFYNDTEATNIKCTQIALSSFDERTILILGGYERGQDFNGLKDYIKNVKAIMAIGESRKRVSLFAQENNILCFEYEFLKDAVLKAYEISEEKDVILLSPASASWDQYKRCEDRGDEFKKIVTNLQ